MVGPHPFADAVGHRGINAERDGGDHRRTGGTRLTFNPDETGPTWLTNAQIPSAAVAHDEEALLDMFAGVGLKPAKSIVYGTWCGRPNAVSYQDLLVLEKVGSP